MAEIKISQLPSLTTMTDAAEVPVVASGSTQQITGANLKTYFTGNVTFTGNVISTSGTNNLLINLDGQDFIANTANGGAIGLYSGNSQIDINNDTPGIEITSVNVNLVARAEGAINLDATADGVVDIESAGNTTITVNGRVWTFSEGGALDVPKYGVYEEYGRVRGNGLQLRGDTNGGGSYTNIILPNNTDCVTNATTVANEAGNVLIFANGQSWTFDGAGTLTAPGNISTDGYLGAGNIGVSDNVATKTLVTDPGPLSNFTAAWGARAFISDGNLTAVGNFGAQVSGGGANNVPVWSDGANWFIG